MANRAYLYSSERPDDWERPEEGYHDSRWTIPLAWWFFFTAGDIVWADVHDRGSRWREVKLSAHKGRALDRFAARRSLLASLLGGGLGPDDVDRFESAVTGRPGSYLLVDPSEVLGGLSESDAENAAGFERVLASLDGKTTSGVLHAAERYVGELGAGSGGWECQVFGYTYAWDAGPGAAADGGA